MRSNPLLLAGILEAALVMLAPAFGQSSYGDRAFQQSNIGGRGNVEMIEFCDGQAGSLAIKKDEFIARAHFAFFVHGKVKAAMAAAQKLSDDFVG